MPQGLHHPRAGPAAWTPAPASKAGDAGVKTGTACDKRAAKVAPETDPPAAAPPKARRAGRAKRKALTLADYQALGAFRSAVRRFLAFSEAGAVAQAITPQQHQALLAIKAHEGEEAMRVSELAACLLIKPHSAVGLVGRLVDRGLVARGASPHDRRRILLTLTRAGEQVLETISRKNLRQLKTTMPAFTDLLTALEQLDLPPLPADAESPDGPAG
ncbi:MAG: MarR family winged helix-turn-helix transcriptional regulator [Phenylobacterium sp.]